jgi:Holliday junction resolvase
MPINSRQKGAQGEREWARWLRDNLGVKDARRGCQHAGGPNSPDVIGLAGTHAEVKRSQKLNLWAAMYQAIRDCERNLGYVAHRKNGEEWLITIRAKDLIKFNTLLTAHLKKMSEL